jgi:hypothetical protein
MATPYGGITDVDGTLAAVIIPAVGNPGNFGRHG